LKLTYAVGITAGLPPLNGFCFPAHIGGVAAGEPTFFDAVFGPPVTPTPNGWMEFPGFTFPLVGRYYGYLYDTNGNGALDFPQEPYLIYDSQTGTVIVHIPP